jgi:hypothetical protein
MQSNDGSQSPSQESGVSPSPVPPMVEAFSITRDDAEILQEYKEQFEEGDKDFRNTIVANAMAELCRRRSETEPFDKIDASKVSASGHTIQIVGSPTANTSSQKIRKWFSNHYSQPERQYFKFTCKWSARNAFYHMCHDEIMMEVEKMSGALPGSQPFLGCFQEAITKLWRMLTEEEQEVYASLGRKWLEKAPPPHIWARYVVFKSFSLG